jgi:hypothetical protein
MDMIEDRTPANWLASLAESKAEAEAGHVVPFAGKYCADEGAVEESASRPGA